MKNLFFFAAIVIILSSCSIQKPDACIAGPIEIQLGTEASYTHCGEGEQYAWALFNQHDQTQTISTSNTPSFIVDFKFTGSYIVQLTVSNKNGETDTQQRIVKVTP